MVYQLLLLFAQLTLAAVTLRQDVPLRAGCEADSDVVAEGKQGEAVQIRFAVAGSSTPCYKVAIPSGSGYVSAALLDGLDSFESARNAASGDVSSVKVSRTEVDTVQRRAVAALDSAGPLSAASKLLDAGQPKAALAALDGELRRPKPNADTLLLAGVAAWKADDPKLALGYWKSSLELRPDPRLRDLYAKVERETAGDRSGQKTVGMRIDLRYEGESVTPELAREMLDALDSEYSRISSQLGCRAEERITAIVQSKDAYFKTTGAAIWSAGQFDGRIRIALIDGERGVGPMTRRSFAHELVHACLASMGGWPSWFHEGMAQKLSGDRLSKHTLDRLAEMSKAGQLPSFESLATGWSRFDSEKAWAAYSLALLAADRFTDRATNYGLRYVLTTPSKFTELSSEIARSWITIP